ncbi:MAG: ABC transporter ATP-binding protein [Nitrososphaerales archaeon]
MISVSNLSIKLDGFSLRDVNFAVKGGECLTIVGPNGSGKTTLLECIAGLRRPQQGKIVIGEIDATHLPPEKRRIGYVPQDYVLFPHLNVEENVAFGLKNKDGLNKAREIMNWLNIHHLANRNVRSLSGGEKQKVALARALAVNPKALLLDEPLAALDPLSRERLRKELKELISKILNTLSIPVIYVTHDLSEAELISDYLAVMNGGRIEQIGLKEEVFEEPASRFVAEFLGYNTFEGVVVESKEDTAAVEAEGALIHVKAEDTQPGEKVALALRPQNIILSHKNELVKKWQHCRCNIIIGTITEVSKIGAVARVSIDAGIKLRADAALNTPNEFTFKEGDRVYVQFKADSVKLIKQNKLLRLEGDLKVSELNAG